MIKKEEDLNMALHRNNKQGQVDDGNGINYLKKNTFFMLKEHTYIMQF